MLAERSGGFKRDDSAGGGGARGGEPEGDNTDDGGAAVPEADAANESRPDREGPLSSAAQPSLLPRPNVGPSAGSQVSSGLRGSASARRIVPLQPAMSAAAEPAGGSPGGVRGGGGGEPRSGGFRQLSATASPIARSDAATLRAYGAAAISSPGALPMSRRADTPVRAASASTARDRPGAGGPAAPAVGGGRSGSRVEPPAAPPITREPAAGGQIAADAVRRGEAHGKPAAAVATSPSRVAMQSPTSDKKVHPSSIAAR